MRQSVNRINATADITIIAQPENITIKPQSENTSDTILSCYTRLTKSLGQVLKTNKVKVHSLRFDTIPHFYFHKKL